ncbi:polar growth protein [Podila epigama]|nr:polar growth protein [Podila epigama]
MEETVYAIHNFEAEAEDEISFHIGEPIVVVQKDELYQDGWWEGRNVRGEIGLFPMNYTVPTSNSKAIAQTVEESLNDPELSGHPSTWSIQQVAYWLRWCGFASVQESFIENEISGAILLELNLNNLKELDITSFGKRFNIMNAITSLKQCAKGGHKSKYASLATAVSAMYAATGGPNIPPRMVSQSLGPSPRASYDPRGDYTRDNPHDLYDSNNNINNNNNIRNGHSSMVPSVSGLQSPPVRHQHLQLPSQQNEYDQGRLPGSLGRSDTIGSMRSGGSHGDYNTNGTNDPSRAAQRQSITSAYSSNSNPHRGGQWDRNNNNNNNNNQSRPQQMLSPPAPSHLSPNQQHQYLSQPQSQSQRGMTSSEFDDHTHGTRSMDFQQHSQDQFSRNGAVVHEVDHRESPINGKADPSDKVVPLDMIGKPDYAGWLKKRGDTYRTWKSRWFMLKGVTLYYMNSPKDNASKDYINLIGYKIIQDENIYAGKYCFKAVHDELRNFYFYTDSENDMKGWLKALMKVTIGRDPTAPVISSSNIPTIPLHVARKLAPRPPSPSSRNRGLGPNGQPMHPQQQHHQQQYDQKYHMQHQHQHQHHQQQKQHQQQHQPSLLSPPPMQQLLDYDDQDSDGDEFLPKDYGNAQHGGRNGGNHQNGLRIIDEGSESPILQCLSVPPSSSLQQQQQQQQQKSQRHSFVDTEQDDPWRDEDGEGFGPNGANHQGQQREQEPLKLLRPDSELDSFREAEDVHQDPNENKKSNSGWTQEQYVAWINRNLPESVEPVRDMVQSLRSGVVLVRLIEQLSGEAVDKRIPNATYTLQMLENLLTVFKFMDRVGVATDGYTVKDIFNGNEEKIVQMFESIKERFPSDAVPVNESSRVLGVPSGQARQQAPTPVQTPQPPTTPLPAAPLPSGPKANATGTHLHTPLLGDFQVQPPPGTPPTGHPSSNSSNNNNSANNNNNVNANTSNENHNLTNISNVDNNKTNTNDPSSFNAALPTGGRVQAQHTSGSEYEALYDEAARSTIS